MERERVYINNVERGEFTLIMWKMGRVYINNVEMGRVYINNVERGRVYINNVEREIIHINNGEREEFTSVLLMLRHFPINL